MRNAYSAHLIAILLVGLPFFSLAQSPKLTSPVTGPSQNDCAVVGQVVINGPDVLAGTSQYYLTPDPNQNTFQPGNITWSVSPASAFNVYGSTTSSTLLMSSAASCSSTTGTISVTLPVYHCGMIQMTTYQKVVTVMGGSGGVPAVRGTYYCTTCADQSARTLLLDGNTNNVTRYGTYRMRPLEPLCAWCLAPTIVPD
jgi:hypothetical protein